MMKASELVRKIQDLIELHGDLPIDANPSHGTSGHINDVYHEPAGPSGRCVEHIEIYLD